MNKSNAEKAREISQSQLIEEGIWHYATAEVAALEMAEWKDAQLKEYLERKRSEMERGIPYCSDSDAEKFSERIIMINEILNDLFTR